MYGPKPWHDTDAMDEMQRIYLEELPERWPDAEYPEHCAIAFLDGMRRFRAAAAPFISSELAEQLEEARDMLYEAAGYADDVTDSEGAVEFAKRARAFLSRTSPTDPTPPEK